MSNLPEIKQEHVKRFKRYSKQLDKLMMEIRVYAPSANLYAEDLSNLILMKGDTHDDTSNCNAMHDNIVESVRVKSLSGGGF